MAAAMSRAIMRYTRWTDRLKSQYAGYEMMTEKGPIRQGNRKGIGHWLALLARCILFVGAMVLLLRMIFPTGPILEKGTRAPAAFLESYDGQRWDLSRYAGKPVFINFWATWCPPCLQEIPHLVRAADIYKDKVHIVGFTVDSRVQEVFSTIQRFGINYPVAKVDSATVERWGAQSLPSSFLLDENQNVIWSMRGALTRADVDKVLGNLLSSRADF
jgi:thiol-disulfide isomerase/thioredoxin